MRVWFKGRVVFRPLWGGVPSPDSIIGSKVVVGTIHNSHCSRHSSPRNMLGDLSSSYSLVIGTFTLGAAYGSQQWTFFGRRESA